MAENNDADILSRLMGSISNIDHNTFINTESGQNQIKYLQDIDNTLKQILRNGGGMSASNAANGMPGTTRSGYSGGGNSDYFQTQQRNRRSSSGGGGFLDGFEQSMIDAVLGKDFKDKIRGAVSNFADELGVNIGDIPNTLGKELGSQVMGAVKNSGLGKQLFGSIDSLKQKGVEWVKSKYNQGREGHINKMGGLAPGEESASANDILRRPATKTPSGQSQQDKESFTQTVGKSASKSASQIDAIYVDTIIVKGQIQDKAESIQDKVKSIKEEAQSKAEADARVSDKTEGVKDDLEGQAKDQIKDQIKDQLGDQFKGLKDKGLSKATDFLTKFSGKDGFIGQLANKGLGILGKFGAGGAGAAGAGAAGAGAAGTATALTTTAAGTAGAATGASAALAGLGKVATSVITKLGPWGLAIGAAILVVKKLGDALKPVIESFKKMVAAAKAAANRDSEQRKKNLEFAKQRMESDIKVMMEEPFNILKEAAQKAYDVWDHNLRLISASQGYNKSDLQSLMASFTERLKNEGLSDVIAGTDVTESLAKVLESGLSGTVAEEFAFLATKLNAAVPGQDFYGYAGTYASLAANAIRLGKSEADSISYANQQMELFASNVLYASRQIAGGFTTGLKNAQSLFDQSVQIAQASRTGDPSKIAGVLTSVSAITGAIAPDLAQSMTDAVVRAATGGNSSELTALRSLAGINASNTEFLKQLADNPQSVFSDLFTGLAKMQNMSENAWMEVAEGVSSMFGMSMDAFARVDFNYLANAISKMNVNNASLDENVKLLKSGETTTTQEQMKIAEINKKLIDEGLSYVLDNEAARAIQENMWAEQRQRELTESTFAVNLQGAAMDFLESIKGFVEKIMNFLNPFAWLKKLGNLVATAMEGVAQEADLRQMLELGKVGKGNIQSLFQLTTRNQNLNVVDKLVDMMGGFSTYGMVSGGRRAFNALGSIGSGQISQAMMRSLIYNLPSQVGSANSNYMWGTIGKSNAAMISGASGTGGPAMGVSQLSNAAMPTNSEVAQTSADQNIDRMIEELAGKLEADKSLTYEKWTKSARSYGISDFDEASRSAGYSETQLRDYFAQREMEQGVAEKARREEKEEKLWDRLAFDGDSLWNLTEYANMVRDQMYEEMQAYHATFTSMTQYANDVRDLILVETQAYHSTFISMTEYANQIRDYIYSENLRYGTEFREMTQYANDARDIMKFNDSEYYLKYIELTETTHSKMDLVLEAITLGNGYLGDIFDKLDIFYDKWVDFYITQYDTAVSQTKLANEIAMVDKNDQRDAIYSLADILTQNGLDLKNPTVQTNALLAEILKLLSAIMVQNNNKVDGLSLFDTLSGMSMGLTKATTAVV